MAQYQHLPIYKATYDLLARVTQATAGFSKAYKYSLGDRLRVAGMMEFRKPEAPLDRRRVKAIVDSARPLLAGADLDNRKDEWVGSRPCTPDGLPLIGVTNNPRVFVAGGHGMWGITLGPVTGELLAQQIATGMVPQELLPFSPTR